MSKLIQIVPRLPPSVSGVGDYANLLAGELKKSQQIETEFLVADPRWEEGAAELNGSAHKLKNQSSEELIRHLSSYSTETTVCVHFVGYGYQKRGCPFWLVQGIEKWRKEKAGRRLVVMFHELFASGHVWQSSFWLSPVQRQLAARMARVADRCVTNMKAYANQIARFAPKHLNRVSAFPVFSNVGEPVTVPQLSQRAPELVIFGGGKRTLNALTSQAESLERLCMDLQLERIVAIGSKESFSWRGKIPIEETGVLPAAEVSRRLLSAQAGYLDYFLGYLGKSTLFGAYCAHGLLPILPQRNPSEMDDVHHRQAYFTIEDVKNGLSASQRQLVADGARTWYSRHTLTTAASSFASLCRE